MLERWLRDLKQQGSPAALGRALHLGLGVLVLPALPLGAVYALWGKPSAAAPPLTLLWLWLLACAVSGAAYWFARNTAADPSLPRPVARLTAAFQLATVPAVPVLLACAFLYLPLWALALGLLGLGGYALARWQLAQWEK